MVASSLGVEFVSYNSILLWQPCRANFRPSAVPISVLLMSQFLCFCRSGRGQSLGHSWHQSRQAPGLSWVLATPDRGAWWHGDCAIAGGTDGYQNRAEQYGGIRDEDADDRAPRNDCGAVSAPCVVPGPDAPRRAVRLWAGAV